MKSFFTTKGLKIAPAFSTLPPSMAVAQRHKVFFSLSALRAANKRSLPLCLSSCPREPPPQALTEPDLRVSPHPALLTQPLVSDISASEP